MYIKSVRLYNFRNYEKLNIDLNKGLNIIYGANGAGKTNFLEALYFCATGRSKRTNRDKELIMFGKDEAHIRVLTEKDTMSDRLDIHLKRVGYKGIAINGVPIKKLGDLFGVLNAVIFSPEDLQIIKAGPSERRKFMDMEICQLSQVYYYDLAQYYKILKQRNNLLKSIQKNKSLRDTLFVWDEQLVNYGEKIIVRRRDFIKELNIIASKIHSAITSHSKEKENLKIVYKPSANEDDFENKLKDSIDRDIFTGVTNYGIHKDDLTFLINDFDARTYGSQGQQRTVALAAKLAEIDIISNRKNTTPVLLLDDVLSELDKSRQKYLLEYIKNIQTIITATGSEDIVNQIKPNENAAVFYVNNNSISIC